MRHPICLLFALILAFLASCGPAVLTTSGERAGGTVLLPGVPFIGQDDFQCGPASLATVINYWNRLRGSEGRVTAKSIVDEIYSPTAKGVLGMDLELSAQRHGFSTEQYSGSIADLRRLIDKATPAIILVDLGIGVFQTGHFMVVTGYTSKGVVANTGRVENELFTEGKLDSIWKKTGYWTLVVRPRG